MRPRANQEKTPYKTYVVLIACGTRAKVLDVVAVSIEAAHADVLEAYEGARIVATQLPPH